MCLGLNNHPEYPSNHTAVLWKPPIAPYSNTLERTSNVLATRSHSSFNCTWLFSQTIHCLTYACIFTPKDLFSLKTHYLFILRSILLPSLFQTHFLFIQKPIFPSILDPKDWVGLMWAGLVHSSLPHLRACCIWVNALSAVWLQPWLASKNREPEWSNEQIDKVTITFDKFQKLGIQNYTET